MPGQSSHPNTLPTELQTLPTAPLWRRLMAMIYDSILVIAIWFATTMLYLFIQSLLVGGKAMQSTADQGGDLGGPTLSASLFLATFLFFAYFWRKLGQTLGMQVWRIKVISLDGLQLSWSQALLRFFGAAISALPLGAGYLWMLFDKEQMTWHDKYSESKVVVVPIPAKGK